MVTLAGPKTNKTGETHRELDAAPAAERDLVNPQEAEIQNQDLEIPVQTTKENKMNHITRKIIEVYDWVLGPPTTEKERVARTLAEFNRDRMRVPLDT